MEKSGGQIAAKRAKPTGDGEDHLSALPDDLLRHILVRLDSTAQAVRTSVLASRWRNLWRSLSEVHFDPATDSHRIRVLLDAPGAPDLHRLCVTTEGAGPDSAAAWLPAATRRLIGALVYRNVAPKKADDDGEEVDSGDGRIQLPCFEKATKIDLDLGFLGLALPSVGVFNRLTDLSLSCVQFPGPCDLGNAVSSSRCPCLRKLRVWNTRGLDTLTIHSKSLRQILLKHVNGLQQLTIGAPVLQELEISAKLLAGNQLVADISTPQLLFLIWKDTYDSQFVNLGKLDQLRLLGICFFVFGKQKCRELNHRWLSLLQQFQVLHHLHIELLFHKNLDDFQYLMGDITVLPRITALSLALHNRGHSFGAGSFHLLRMCTGLRKLILMLVPDLEAESKCSSGCICDEPTSWKTEELVLNHLEYIGISNLLGAEHEVTFLKQLFKWAVVLKNMRIIFQYQISESKAREFRQALAGSSRPEAHVEFRMFHDGSKRTSYLLPPEDQVTGS